MIFAKSGGGEFGACAGEAGEWAGSALTSLLRGFYAF